MKDIIETINEAKAKNKFGKDKFETIGQSIASSLSQLEDVKVACDDFCNEICIGIAKKINELTKKGYEISGAEFFDNLAKSCETGKNTLK